MPPKREWLDKDYYDILGVSEEASQSEIKKSYRKLAQRHHPDSESGDESRFKEVNEAYQVLGDEDTRKEYDEIRRLGAAGLGGGPGGGFSGGFPGGMQGDQGDLGDLLNQIFEQSGAGGPFGGQGFGGGRRRAEPRQGRDLRASVHLSFEDALTGVRTRLRIRGDGPCDDCGGSGAAPGTRPRRCPQCGGRGEVAVDQGFFSMSQPCPTCSGRGQIIEEPCPTCGGDGRVVKPREVTVRIPAGVKDGATIRVPGRGGPGANGGPAGDVLVDVEVEPDPLFGRRGDHVTLRVPLTYTEAALGTRLTVPTPLGGSTTIRIPPGTASGRTFRVRGRGVPDDGADGDLLVTVEVQIPEDPTGEERELLERLAELEDTSARHRLLGLDGGRRGRHASGDATGTGSARGGVGR